MANIHCLAFRVESDIEKSQKLHCREIDPDKVTSVELAEKFLVEQKNLCEYIVNHVEDFVTEFAHETNILYCMMELVNPKFNKVSASSIFSYLDLIEGVRSPYNFEGIHNMLYKMIRPDIPEGYTYKTYTHMGHDLQVKIMLSLQPYKV